MLDRIEVPAKAGLDKQVIVFDRRLGLRPSGKVAVDWMERVSDEQ